MSNFIYYEKLEDYEEQVKKAKLCDEKDKEIERLKNVIDEAIEYIKENTSDGHIIVDDLNYYDVPELLRILQGGDKE